MITSPLEPFGSTILGHATAATLLVGLLACGLAASQDVERNAPTVAHPGATAVGSALAWPAPANLVAPDFAKPLLLNMWRRSPTFRRQCARLAEHPSVTVQIEIDSATRHGRALSHLDPRDPGLMVAVEIEMRQPALYAELIAHELEHVIEYIEGTDLAQLARQRVAGVVDLGGRYETARARSIGLSVAREMRLR